MFNIYEEINLSLSRVENEGFITSEAELFAKKIFILHTVSENKEVNQLHGNPAATQYI